MKKIQIIIIFLLFVYILVGCGSGSNTVYVYKNNEPEINTKKEVVDKNGTFAEITLPSGAKIKATEEQTFQEGVEVTIDEEKISEAYISQVGTPLIYRFKAKLQSDNPLEAPVEVKTLSKPLTVTIPNNISDKGVCYYGIRENSNEPWRYSRCLDSNIISNFVATRAATQIAPKEVTFQLYRANIEFALFVFDFSDKDNSLTTVDQAKNESNKKILISKGIYTEDVKVSTTLKGLELNNLKPENLAVKITFNSDIDNLDTFKVNNTKCKLDCVSNKASTGGKYAYSFVFTGINFESQIDSEIKFDFVLNIKNLSIEKFPTTFLIEIYSVDDTNKKSSLRSSLRFSEDDGEGDNGGVMPFSYSQLMQLGLEELPTYSIIYDLDGGDLEIDNPESYNEDELPITLNNPTKEDYEFIGWTGSNGNVPELTVTIEEGTTGDLEFEANFAPIYDITYDLNGGSLAEGNPDSYYESVLPLTLNNPTKGGYVFIGWTGSNGDVPELVVTINEGTAEPLEYFANYAEVEFTITYTLNGGTVTPPNPTGYNTASATFTLNNPEKPGYSFSGWSGTGLTGKKTTVTITSGSSGNRTYTANWSKTRYSLSYTLNGGTVSPSNQTRYYVDTETFSLINPTKNYYDFVGWSGTDLVGTNNITVTIPKGSIGNRTYTANFAPTSYSISYNLNDGTVGGENPTSYDITSATITLHNPSKIGYIFKGWSGTDLTGSNNTTVKINNGSHGNRSYEANYNLITYNISYELHSGAPESANPSTYNITSSDITLNNPIKDYYDFTGWSGSGLEGDENTEVIIPTGSIEDRNYEAHYNPISYTITYDLHDGTLETDNPENYDITSATITLHNPSKIGYIFKGWSGTGLEGDTNTSVTIPIGSHGNRSYEANYTPVGYVIEYELHDGILATENPTVYDVASSDITLNNPAKDYYEFTGWSGTGLEGNTNTTVVIYTGSMGNRSFEAHYNPISYTIDYVLNDGILETANPATYDVTSAPITLNNPNKDYYDFIGWSGTDLYGNNNTLVTIPTGSHDNRTYEANFSPISFRIDYNLDGGNVTPPNPTSYDITSATITLNNPTKRGYDFDGWSGTELEGTDNTDVSIPTGSHDDRSYDANYSLIIYTITYDLDGGIENESPNPTTYDVTSATITLNPPSRIGYDFVGWSGTDLDGEDNMVVTIPHDSIGNREYTAHWVLAPIRLNLDSDFAMQLRPIPEGTFTMGSPLDELGRANEETQHSVTITKLFYLSEFEVTQKQYWKATETLITTGNDYPAVNVTYDNAKAFCTWLNNHFSYPTIPEGYHFDLPTEAQWEFACRAGTTKALNNNKNLETATGGDANLAQVAWYYSTSSVNDNYVAHDNNETRSLLQPNSLGLYNMHGNVAEWCKDWWSQNYYSTSSSSDPTGPTTGTYRVVRGGNFSSQPKLCRSASRNKNSPTSSSTQIGFRVALVPNE